MPHTAFRRGATVSATLKTVTVLQDGLKIARHQRTFDKGEQIENPEHVAARIEQKMQARHHRGQDRLVNAAPSSVASLSKAIERVHRLGSTSIELDRLLDQYHAGELEAALIEVLDRDAAHLQSVRQVFEQRRKARIESHRWHCR